MRDTLVLTIIGADRAGLVESLAAKIASVGGNWEESRMARLAGQFAGVLLVTVDTARSDELVRALRGLDAAGLQVTVRPTAAPAKPTGATVHLDITGQDRPGIVRDISKILVERGANIEELESTVGSAPMSGESMFKVSISFLAPSGLDIADLRARLEALAGELMVDVSAG
jgi:glycine cleavage system regulatory protein